MRDYKRRGFCLPGGYRYCGPGCSGPGAPINYVDSCCKRHDDCIDRYGPCCKCDEELIRCVQSRTRDRGNEGSTARLISGFMRLRSSFRCR
ncbi:hypothetical protein J2S17_002454 [Cytobacillus purgationiresistens]|uniref:Parvovirus coat protein VP1-like protein n=1 Tax=Cytobacillus purgationiresistens TaxID=863449 RepID=A0ABU0AH43_9BACI|nr:hypothetical protein [Cytobacillus purgationiresistens]